MIDAVKFAMGNNGNPLVVMSGDRRAAAESLLKEFSAKAAILFSREEIVDALNDDSEIDVIIWDGESREKSYLERVFEKYPNARRVCFAKSEFFLGELNLYDTVIVG